MLSHSCECQVAPQFTLEPLSMTIGKALKGVKPNFGGLHARETHALFSNAVNDILYVHETYPNTQWSSMNTKAFYCILINKPNAKVSLYYLSSPILSPPTREHLFFTFHNLLLTRVRKKNLKIAMGYNCTHCKQAPEDIQHIFLCPASCLLYTSPSPRDRTRSRMPSSA